MHDVKQQELARRPLRLDDPLPNVEASMRIECALESAAPIAAGRATLSADVRGRGLRVRFRRRVCNRQQRRTGDDRHDGAFSARQEDRASLNRWIESRYLILAEAKHVADISQCSLLDPEDDLGRSSRNERSTQVGTDKVVDLL